MQFSSATNVQFTAAANNIGPQRREQVKEQGARSQPPPAMLAASASSGFASNRRQATQGVEHDLKKRYL